MRMSLHGISRFLVLVWATLVMPAFSADESADVVIYGATPGGITAAIQLRKLNKSVILLEPTGHLGGLTAGGLGATDIGNKKAIGGLSREFYHRIWQHYQAEKSWTRETARDYQSKRQVPGEETMWTFEPHVATNVFTNWLAEHQVRFACINNWSTFRNRPITQSFRSPRPRRASTRRFAEECSSTPVTKVIFWRWQAAHFTWVGKPTRRMAKR